MTTELVKGLTLKSLVIGILGTIMLSMLTITLNAEAGFSGIAALGARFGQPAWILSSLMVSTGLLFVVLVISAIANKVSGRNVITRQELAVISMMFTFSAVQNGYYNTNVTWWFTIKPPGIAWEPDPIAVYNKFPAIIRGGSPETVRDYWLSVLPVSTWNINWSIVGPVVVWSIVFAVSLWLTGMFFSNFLRRRWIEMEEIAFPTAQLHGDSIAVTQRDEHGIVPMFKDKWLLVGIGISLVLYATAFFIIFPLDPKRGSNYPLPGGVNYWAIANDFTGLAILPWVSICLNIHPFLLGWGFLIPTDIILGFIVGWIGFWFIFPLIMNGSGVPGWTSFTAGQTAGAVWWHNISWIYTMAIGMFAVLAAMTIWSCRKFFRPSIGASEDPNAPVSNKINWIGFIGFLVIMLAALAAVQVQMLSATLYILLLMFLAIGSVRVLAESGGNMGGPETFSNTYFYIGGLLGPIIAWGTGAFTDPTSTAAYMTYELMGWAWFIYQSIEVSMFWPLHGYKLGNITRTRVKDMFRTTAIVMVISTIVGAIGAEIWFHVLPISGASGTLGKLLIWINGGLLYRLNGGYVTGHVNVGASFGPLDINTTVMELVAVGLVIGVVFAVLRAKVARFPIPLAGLAFGALMGDMYWSPLLIVWIIKTIILRTRGIEPINKKLRPLGLGLILGFAFWYLIIFITTVYIWCFWKI